MQSNIQDVQEIVNVGTPGHEDHSIVANGATQVTPEQIQRYLKMLRKEHNTHCRKKGFKGHIHQAAGHKLVRKLDRQGSLYARPSTVGQTFLDMQASAFKIAKAAA